jgi:hypothetical protein
MTVDPSLSENPPSQTLGSGSSSGIKKGSNVFRPGEFSIPIIPGGGGPFSVNAPYGPMAGKTTFEGIQVKALYNATDEEVSNILLGIDGTNPEGTPLSPTFRKGLKDILLSAGYLSKKDYIPSAEFGYADYAAMRELLKEANYLGGYNWREAVGIVTDRLATKGTGARTSTYTQYSLSRPEEAELIVDAALNNFLGRGATKEEKANLSKALRKYEQETPTVTTTTAGGTSTTSTTMTGPTTAGRQQAILGGFTEGQSREMSGVVNTELGNLFTTLLRNA